MSKHNFYIAAGALLLSLSVILTGYTFFSDGGNADLDSIVYDVENYLPEREAGVPDENKSPFMPAFEYGGNDYVALIEMPDYNIKLPVLSEYSKKPYSAPRCFGGSLYNSSFSVTGSEKQLDFIFLAEAGDRVNVTDMHGNVFSYEVSKVSHTNLVTKEKLESLGNDFVIFAYSRKNFKYTVMQCDFK